jgi:hypothetical protein
MLKYVHEGIIRRNRLLYAGGSGFFTFTGDVEALIQMQLETVTTLLTIYLLIDMYPEHQLFVQQCLEVFIDLLPKSPPK